MKIKKNKIISIITTIFILLFSNKIYADSTYIKLNEQNTTTGINRTVILKVKAYGNIDNSNIMWYSSDETIATVSSGVVRGIREGTVIITAKKGSYTATCKVNVLSNYIDVTSLKLSNYSDTILKNETKQIMPIITPSNATNKSLIYTSSNENIASVDSNGFVTGRSDGEATITIKSISSSFSVSYKIKVTSNVALKGISINKTSLTMTEQDTANLYVNYNPTNATNKKVTWSSSDTKIVEVDQNGKITAKSKGTATIKAISQENGYIGKCTITVNELDKTLKEISLDKKEITLEKGQESTLNVSFNPSYAANKKITWTTSDKKIVTVENGKIVAQKAGKATITVTSEEGNFTAKCEVIVKSQPVESIKFENEKIKVYTGSTTTLEIITTPEDSILEKEKWTSSDETIATIEEGKLTAIRPGIVTIKVSNEDESISAEIEVTIEDKPEEPLNIMVEGYNIKFDKNVKTYNLKIKNEKSLKISVNKDSDNYTINGNQDLKDGSLITISIKNGETYVINVEKEKNMTLYFIIAISFLLLINIIRMLSKNKKK